MAAVSAPKPPTITAGKGPEPLGRSMPAEKLALRPLWETFTVMPWPETVPVTLDGLPGFSCGFRRWRSPEFSLPEGGR